jgi:hypothetical protein
MIPYEELDRALARWKARSQNAAVDAAQAFEASGPSGIPVPGRGSVPVGSGPIEGLPPPPDRTGEIDLGDAVVETYDDDGS